MGEAAEPEAGVPAGEGALPVFAGAAALPAEADGLAATGAGAAGMELGSKMNCTARSALPNDAWRAARAVSSTSKVGSWGSRSRRTGSGDHAGSAEGIGGYRGESGGVTGAWRGVSIQNVCLWTDSESLCLESTIYSRMGVTAVHGSLNFNIGISY